MKRIVMLFVLLGIFLVGNAYAQEEFKIIVDDGEAEDQFGLSVSISGVYAIVGVHGDDDNGENSGSAYIFHLEDGGWVQQAKLLADDGERLDHFGFSVSISEDYAIIGAHGDGDNGVLSGSAYIFHLEDGEWVQQEKLIANDAEATDSFGSSVFISENYAVVGVPSGNNNGRSTGSVYVFHLEDDEWVQQQKLTADDGENADYFGDSVSILGEYVVVGVPGGNNNGRSTGSAYVFHLEDGEWIQQQKLTADDGESVDYFGTSVSISGDYAVVGASLDDDNGEDSGSAYIYSSIRNHTLLSIRFNQPSDIITCMALNPEREWENLTQDDDIRVIQLDEENNLIVDLILLQDYFAEYGEIQRIDLLNDDWEIKGHIAFNYSEEDFGVEKKVDAFLELHEDVPPLGDFPNWEYFQAGEFPVSMLIPPHERSRFIRTDLHPLLLVHGVSGEYPYWGNTASLLSNFHDAWQFYYPYDAEIDYLSELLSEAIPRVLLGEAFDTESYEAERLHVVAHSMGGLVTRSYIQDTGLYQGGDTKISKFLMLGTPNHGSYGSYRLVYRPVIGDFLEYFRDKDKEAPAYRQMILGSNFLLDLNRFDLNPLYDGAVLNQTYLIIAGTENNWDFLHSEIENQCDGRVAVSSASLLNRDIPLVTMPYRHSDSDHENTNLTEVPVVITNSFLLEDYDPAQPFLLGHPDVEGYWFDENVRLGDPPINEEEGIITFKITGSEESSELYMTTDVIEDQNVLYINNGGEDLSNTLLRIGETNNYFSLNTDYINDLGMGFAEGIYDIEFRCFVGDIDSPHKVYKSVEDVFSFHHLQTSMAELSLTDGELAILNASNFVIPGQGEEPDDIENIFVDSSIESVVFLINATEGEENFSEHDMQITTPSEIVIDPEYAQNNPNVEFSEGDEFAFFYVVSPEVGEWTVGVSEVVETTLDVPIITPINVEIVLPDSVFLIGNEIEFAIPIPENCEDIQITNNLFYWQEEEETWLDMDAIILDLNEEETAYIGQFTALSVGTYQISLDFSCTIQGEVINRSASKSLAVYDVVSVEEDKGDTAIPQDFELEQNYPNPFNPTTTINYKIPKGTFVRLEVYNVLGQIVATLIDGKQSAGNYSLKINMNDSPSGIYFYKLKAGSFSSTRKFVLLK